MNGKSEPTSEPVRFTGKFRGAAASVGTSRAASSEPPRVAAVQWKNSRRVFMVCARLGVAGMSFSQPMPGSLTGKTMTRLQKWVQAPRPAEPVPIFVGTGTASCRASPHFCGYRHRIRRGQSPFLQQTRCQLEEVVASGGDFAENDTRYRSRLWSLCRAFP